MNEEMNLLVAKIAAHERILTLLLSDRLKRLSEGDQIDLKAAIAPDGVTPPASDDIGMADDMAGRTIVYRDTVTKILRSAQEIADLTAG